MADLRTGEVQYRRKRPGTTVSSRCALNLDPRRIRLVGVELAGVCERRQDVLLEPKLLVARRLGVIPVKAKYSARGSVRSICYLRITCELGVHRFADRGEEEVRVEEVQASVDGVGQELLRLFDVVPGL